ncbi:MAG: alpha/beta hydrolase [Methylococcaceae bacterium]|nr:alpha/beta hydrolase [Methylococcaceae bacterium]
MEQQLKFSQFGADNGRIIVYFHGAPGAMKECAIFDLYGQAQGLTFICFDRFSVDVSIDGEAYYQYLAQEIAKQAAGKTVDVIGFSIGAFVALQTCRYLGDGVQNLHLVSAAAPLEAGDFLDAMAGKHVFKLAKALPALFALVCYGQKLLAVFFPRTLFRLFFASAAGGDKGLLNKHEFQSSSRHLLRSCFTDGIPGYTRDMRAYVCPWASTLSGLSVNTYIWHGAADNWSPKAMAIYLKTALLNCAHIEILEGLSHYSCLYETAPKICKLLGKH